MATAGAPTSTRAAQQAANAYASVRTSASGCARDPEADPATARSRGNPAPPGRARRPDGRRAMPGSAFWHPGSMADNDLAGLLAEQIAYYRARADEYDATYPLDARADADARARLVTTLEALAPYGRVLELACGTGQWTVELARHATAVTAVDAAPEALAICRRRVGVAHVRLVEADLFTWRAGERFDLVFFAGWLSHVPPQRFDAFWALVADCLAPGGRVFVIDELPAVAAVERVAAGQPAPAVRREVATGHAFRAVKVLHAPGELGARLDALGWDADITTVGWRFYAASLRRR